MRWRLLIPVLAFPFLISATARAVDWSSLSAPINSPGTNVISLEAPFPGFVFGWQHGVTSNYDFGLRLGLEYAAFNEPSTVPYFGFPVGIVNRFQLYHQGMMTITVHGDVGLYVYAHQDAPTFFGFYLTPGGVISFALLPKLLVSGLFDLPMGINVTTSDTGFGAFGGASGAFFGIGMGFGGTVEYAFTDRFHLGLKLEFGPQWATNSDGSSPAALGMVVALNAAYHL